MADSIVSTATLVRIICESPVAVITSVQSILRRHPSAGAGSKTCPLQKRQGPRGRAELQYLIEYVENKLR